MDSLKREILIQKLINRWAKDDIESAVKMLS